MDDHPGGDEVLLTATGKPKILVLDRLSWTELRYDTCKFVWYIGKDATDDFEDVGHSDDAREMLKKYFIGEIDSSTIPAERKHTLPSSTTPSAGVQGSGNSWKILQFLLPLLILVAALAFRSFYQKE